ncbi:MAG: histidine kinase N-terminal 7TM domain-containing protein [Capsulimonadales bacterium]|nr:histidine kinase N-terminal 7TM domain-containing protein [Capsulimonadales bacterium]
MNTLFRPEVVALCGAATLCVVAALLSWRRRLTPGSQWFTLALISCTIWTLAQAAETLVPSAPDKIFCSKMAYFGIATLPVFWFIFALRYQERIRTVRNSLLPLFFMLPVLTIVAVLTNDSHRLVWPTVVPRTSAPNSSLIYEHGPVFWVFAFYGYILLVSGTIMLVRGVVRQHTLYKQQTFAILLGIFFPFIGNIVYLSGKFPIPGVDPTPFFFGISGLWILLALSHRGLFDLAPVARDRLVESMTDGLLVIDGQRRLIDANPAARTLLKLPADLRIGQSLDRICPTLAQLIAEESEFPAEGIERDLPESPGRYFNIRIASLSERNAPSLGQMIVLRDVTEYREAEQELRHLNNCLKDQLDEIHGLKDRLQEQANRDPLTGLYNRRFLLQMLEYQLSATRNPISLVMLDIDYFKQINDRHGHAAGDTVITCLAGMLRTQIINPEFACRFGGEEFVVVLPGVSLREATERGEKWRDLFQSTPVMVQGKPVHVTLSVGVAMSPEHGSNLEALLHGVDTALYAAKNGGRNRVVALPSRMSRREPLAESRR